MGQRKQPRTVVVIDVRRAQCTRCCDPSKPVVAVFFSDLSGQCLTACADCLAPSMERLHGATEIDDVHANFTREDIERELAERTDPHEQTH